MTNTTNYNFNICEGTDVVNPLVQNFPNWTNLDAILKAVEDATVVRATCITSGTVHAVTYTNTDASVFRFTATGDWNVGDTMTVNGTTVNVYLPNGTAPQTGAFVINTEVLAMIQGTRVTLYTTGMTSIDASDVDYDNTLSGLSATDVQNAIDELASSPAGMYALGVVTTDPGCTVTLTKGAKTVNCTEVSSGVYEGSIDEYGNWNVNNVTLGYTRTFTVDVVKIYNLSFIPDGRTITPVNDVQTLLHCAGIFDAGYTVLSQLIADTARLYTVITDNNAIDYLVRSASFASGICGDSTAMTYVGSDNYASNTLLSDATWRNAIINSTYFESVLNVKIPTMTSNTTPTGVVSADSFRSGQEPYKAFSGSGAWRSDHATNAGQSASGWIKYDFGYSFNFVYALLANAESYSPGQFNTLSVETSEDDITYTTAGTCTGTLTNITTTPMSARYVRINLNMKNTASWADFYPSLPGNPAGAVQLYGRKDV